MFRRKSQIFWFLIGGSLLILAGIFALSGVTYPHALPILLVAAGVFIIVAGLLGHSIPFPSMAIFLLGTVMLGLVMSGFAGFGEVPIEIYELTTTEETVDEIELSCTVSTGSIHLSFTANASLIYRFKFTKHYSWFAEPQVLFTKSVINKKLTVNAESSTASVDILLSQAIKSSFNLTTVTGSVHVEVPPTASKIQDIMLKTTTGEVWTNITSTANLRDVRATTTTGKVEALIKASKLNVDYTVCMNTTTGQVMLDVQLINVQSDIIASTSAGKVKADNVVGFIILYKTTTTFHARTPNYNMPQTKKLDIMVSTNTGNADITAHYLGT